MKGICKTCRTEGDVIKHHLNYAQDITIPVCLCCHYFIHRNDLLKEYKPVDVPRTNLWARQRKGESKEELIARIRARATKWANRLKINNSLKTNNVIQVIGE